MDWEHCSKTNEGVLSKIFLEACAPRLPHLTLHPPGGVLYIFWVRGRAIGKGIDFHDFGIRNGINFHDFGIRNGINFCNFHNWYSVGYAFSENWHKVGYIFLKNWYKVGYAFRKNWYKERVCF